MFPVNTAVKSSRLETVPGPGDPDAEYWTSETPQWPPTAPGTPFQSVIDWRGTTSVQPSRRDTCPIFPSGTPQWTPTTNPGGARIIDNRPGSNTPPFEEPQEEL